MEKRKDDLSRGNEVTKKSSKLDVQATKTKKSSTIGATNESVSKKSNRIVAEVHNERNDTENANDSQIMTILKNRKMQSIETSVIKAFITLAKVADKLAVLEKELDDSQKQKLEKIVDECNDSLALLGHANRQMDMTRRNLIKPELRYEYLHLCAQSVPYTAWLFGDDISKTAKEIEDCSKIGHKLQYNNRGGTFRGRMRGRFRGRRPRGRGNFINSAYNPSYGYSNRGGGVGGWTIISKKLQKKHQPTESSAEKQDTIENEVSESSLEFYAGRLKYFSDEWEKITSDKNILEIVKNCEIEFIDNIAPTKCEIYEPRFNAIESEVMDQEIKNLLNMGAIVEASHETYQFLSSIFVRPKKSGEYRVILNLKNLNEYVVYHHFKMDTFESPLNLIKKDCVMASIDIRHAYHSIPIAVELQKYLRFRWKGKHISIYLPTFWVVFST